MIKKSIRVNKKRPVFCPFLWTGKEKEHTVYITQKNPPAAGVPQHSIQFKKNKGNITE